MTITLTKEQEAFVAERMNKDGYLSPQEMLDEAFQLLRAQAVVKEARLEAVRTQLQTGEEQIERGDFKDFADAAELLSYVEQEKQRRRSATQVSGT